MLPRILDRPLLILSDIALFRHDGAHEINVLGSERAYSCTRSDTLVPLRILPAKDVGEEAASSATMELLITALAFPLLIAMFVLADECCCSI